MDRVGVEATNSQPVFLGELYYYLKGKSSYEKENLPPKCHPLHFFMTKNIKVSDELAKSSIPWWLSFYLRTDHRDAA
jgi:hypothetical protein